MKKRSTLSNSKSSCSKNYETTLNHSKQKERLKQQFIEQK